MATQASKKKKVKGKTVNLNDFLSSDGTSSAPGTSYVMANKSWAEQTDEAEEAPIMFTDNKPLPNRAALPTAPRSSQPSELDMSKLPSKPPYTVYLGNIPFDADEEDITSFLRNCNVSQVRLPREGDRLKGFGYAEVEDMDSLMAALALNDQTIRSRRIRVDVAGQGHQDGRDDRTNSDWRSKSGEGNSVFGSGRGSFGGRRNDDPFGSSSGSSDDNWRRQTPADSSSGGAFESRGGGGGRGYEDRGRSGGFGGDRDRGFGNDRGFGGDRDRGFGSFGSSFGGDRGGFEDRGRSGGGFGGDRDRGFGGERDWGDRAGRSRGFENYSEPKDRAFGDRDRGYRDRDFGEGRRQYGGGFARGDDRDAPPGDGNIDSEGPRERKKLVLTKRSDQPSDSAGSKPAPKSTPKSTIFGAAKPVDTAARERAIEERLEREKRLEEQEKMKVEKDREIMVRRERPERPRRESEGEGRTRHSSSSSGKGGPRPIIARRESERSNEDDSAFHKEEPLSPTSPTAPKSPKTPISPRQEDISLQNVVPAPPPKENAWAKRSETVTSPPPPPSAGGGSQQAPPSYREGESRPRGDSGRQEPAGHDGGRQYKDAGPPRENPWKRDGKPARKPGDQGGPGMGRRDAYPRTPPGKDDRRDTRCKEDRPARKSPAEMPKYENKPAPNWSQPNKFSCLMADDEPPCSD